MRWWRSRCDLTKGPARSSPMTVAASSAQPAASVVLGRRISIMSVPTENTPRALPRQRSPGGELGHDLVSELAHGALDLGPRQHRALIEPADDLREPEVLPRRLEPVDDLGGVAEHALIAAELL